MWLKASNIFPPMISTCLRDPWGRVFIDYRVAGEFHITIGIMA
jgi:hypothetical protein